MPRIVETPKPKRRKPEPKSKLEGVKRIVRFSKLDRSDHQARPDLEPAAVVGNPAWEELMRRVREDGG